MTISFKNQESVSLSYFSAVAAKANALMNLRNRDEDGIDAIISKDIEINGQEINSSLAFQVKSVYSKSNYSINGNGDIVYSLKVKNYNDLVKKANLERYLVVLILPEDSEEWVNQNSEELTIKKCMYYISLSGKPKSTNTSTVAVTIPKENVFDDANLLKLLNDVFEEDE